jgi:hypothetical protein
MNIIIKQGKAVVAESSTALPLGVEYEELSRNLQQNTKKKYENLEDLRDNAKKFSLDMINDEKTSTTFLLIPGSMFVNYENSQSDSKPYPQSGEVPFSSSNVWIGR